jgi:hypothetical protein
MTSNFKHIDASEQIQDGTITASLLAPTAAVLSINADSSPNLTGNVQLVSGSHISLSQVGQAITVNATGELSMALTSSHIFVGNVSNVATDTAMTGDVSITNTGVTNIQPAVVTGSKISSATITNTNLATGVFSSITGIGIQSQALDGTSEPGSPVEGQLFYRTDTHQAELWNGTAWVLVG